MKYPIGIQTFEKIISGGFVYVDKTDLIYSLANSSQVYVRPYLSDCRQVFQIGVNFSSEIGTVDGWECIPCSEKKI